MFFTAVTLKYVNFTNLLFLNLTIKFRKYNKIYNYLIDLINVKNFYKNFFTFFIDTFLLFI